MRRRKGTPFQQEITTAAELAYYLKGKQVSAGQFIALCPAHDDRDPSLSIGEGNGKVLIHCFAGCSYQQIVERIETLGFSLNSNTAWEEAQELPDGIAAEWNGKLYAAHWVYKNEAKEVLGYVVRYESGAGEKDVIPFFKREAGKWKAGYPKELKDNHPLYNLDKIEKAQDEDTIWIVEGEKCADALEQLGQLATTAPGGANAPPKADWTPLAYKTLIIWPDNDQAGKVWARNVLQKLNETGGSSQQVDIVLVEKLNLKEKWDVVDWIGMGHGKEDLLSIPTQPAGTSEDIGVIDIDQGRIYDAIDQAEKLLLRSDPHAIFQRGGSCMRISKVPTRSLSSGGETEVTSIGLVTVFANFLLDLFNRKITFAQEFKDSWKAVDPPSKIAQRYLDRSGEWLLHPLSGLIFAPTLRPDGTVLERHGYDEKSGVFYVDTGTKFAPLDKDPTKRDAEIALTQFKRLLSEFPFIKPEDESVALAAILTALVRQSLPTAPLFGFSAPVAGSGKTLLANVVSIISTGKQAVITPHGDNSEEERKHLFAKLLQGISLLLIDNVERPISSSVLCGILTAPDSRYSDRILGKSEAPEVSTRVTFLATGNNLRFQGDMTRRALLCTIDPKCENPESRTFKNKEPLEQYVEKYRERYVRAGLTILKAYVMAGRPKQNIPEYGSFVEWSQWVRSSLVWLGCADPNLTRKSIEEEDPVKMNLGRIISLWNTIYGKRSIAVTEIVRDCNQALEEQRIKSDEYLLAQSFMEVTRAKGKLLDSRSIGQWLGYNKAKVMENTMIVKDKHSPRHQTLWVLEEMK